MKGPAIFILLIAGISAMPQDFDAEALKNERIVTGAIASAIEDLSQQIRDLGLDPLHIDHTAGKYELPVPVIFNAQGEIVDLLFHGLSNIVINQLSFNVLTSRLRFDISLPLIEVTAQRVLGNAVIFGENYNAAVAGRLAIKNISLGGNVQVNVSIISGISIRNIAISFKLEDIYSRLYINVAGRDLSGPTNKFLGYTIPKTLLNFENDINKLIEILARDIINDLL